MHQPTPAATAVNHQSHDDYRPMLDAVRFHFASIPPGPLFTTDVDGRELWNAWLMNLPPEDRQQHDCHACRRFVEAYGGLVTIGAVGHTLSTMFDAAPGIYADAFEVAAHIVESARITGVHVSSARAWGTPHNVDRKHVRTWHHLCVIPTADRIYGGSLLDAGQRAAELREDYGSLCRGLAEYPADVIGKAITIVESEALYRGEKIVDRLRWLGDLHERRAELRGPARDNVTWLAVATAPKGWCHVKASVASTLLDDLAAGTPFESVRAKFARKMAPTQYQRPTAPPTAGNIKQAEDTFAKLGLAPALRRRYARLDDAIAHAVWVPDRKAPAPADGLFGHLLHKPPTETSATAPAITWEKFARTVLPGAEAILVRVPSHGNFHALVTAADPDAPPLIQWDKAEARNPVSWYTHSSGSHAHVWGLSGNALIAVNAIVPLPNEWQEGFAHHGRGVLFVLEGCRPISDERGAMLFPELLRGDLHAVRATIEAHSRSMTLEGRAEANACGLPVRATSGAGHPAPVNAVVTSNGVRTSYSIDRWD